MMGGGGRGGGREREKDGEDRKLRRKVMIDNTENLKMMSVLALSPICLMFSLYCCKQKRDLQEKTRGNKKFL